MTERPAGDETEREAGEARPDSVGAFPPDDVQIAAPVTLSGILEDLVIHAPERMGRPAWRYGLALLTTIVLSSGFHMMVVWRFGAFFHKLRLRPLSIIAEKFIYHWYHCSIPCSVRIGPGLWVPHPLGIVFASRTRIGRGVWMRQHVQIVDIWETIPGGVVGDWARLNTGVILMRGSAIGHQSIVGAAAMVNSVIPPRHLAVGIPAKARPLRPEQVPSTAPRCV